MADTTFLTSLNYLAETKVYETEKLYEIYSLIKSLADYVRLI